MTDSNNSERWLSQHLSRRAALRAGILGAAVPGILYIAKAVDSADAADSNVYIPGAPNFLELGYGWPGKEANAGKISYRRWSDALDIVGAGTAAGYRKVKIWDDLYVQGLLNLRSYIVDPQVPPAWTAFLYAKSVNGQSKPFWKDTTGTAQPLVSRSATLIVAASNASPRSKLGADYVCDGTADEVEIQAAINGLPAGGGKVVLTEGLFTTAADITGVDKLTIEGQGRATLVQAAYNTSPAIFDMRGCDDIQVRNFAIDGQLGTYVCSGIDVGNCKRVLVEGMQFYNIYHSVRNDGTGTVEDLMVRNCYGYNLYRGLISILGALRVSVIGNDIVDGAQEGNAVSCIGFSWSDAHVGCQFVTVSHNHIYHTAVVTAGGNPYSIGIDAGHDTSDAVIADNTLYQCGQAIYTEDGARTTITNNVIHSPGQEGIVVQGDRMVVSNNLIYYGQQVGIKVYHAAGGQWNDIIINGNVVYDCAQGGNHAGIHIQGGNRVLIQGNSSTSNYRGLVLYAPDNTHNSYITAADNDLSGNSNAGYSADVAGSGTNTNLFIRENQGYVTENGGAQASVADGGTINHGLAATPTYVTANPSISGEFVSVTTLDTDHFHVAIKKHDGSAGTRQTIYWRAWV